jgi:hypothetical protein
LNVFFVVEKKPRHKVKLYFQKSPERPSSVFF